MLTKGMNMQNRLYKDQQLKSQLSRLFRIKNKVVQILTILIHYLELNVQNHYLPLIIIFIFNIVSEMKNIQAPKQVKSYTGLYQE